MKTGSKAWTPNKLASYSPTISQQILCEAKSGGSAVQSAPDRENVSPPVTDGQDQELNTPNHGIHCAKVRLRGGEVAIIDAADLPLVASYNWRAQKSHSTYYAMSGTGVLMHRLLLGIHTMGREVEVDHIDGDGLNNTRGNLRLATRSVNLQNRAGYGSTSKFKGVKRSANGNKWLARIYHNKKTILLGTHDTEDKAARAYDTMALALFGPQARLNYPLPCPTEPRAAA